MTDREVRREPGVSREHTESEKLDRVERDRQRSRDDQYSDARNGEHRGDSERGTSWISVILGLLAALGAGVILSGIVGGIVSALAGGGDSAAGSGTAGLIGFLITLLIAYIIGGYTAGRLASRSGLKHGLLVPLLSLILIIVLGIIGAAVGLSFLDSLSGIALPTTPNDAPQNLGTILSVSGLLALVFTFLGGAIGGALGARTGRRRGFADERR